MGVATALLAVASEVEKHVVPVTPAEAHMVGAVRIPRLRIYSNGIMVVDRIVYEKDDIISILKLHGYIKGA